MSPDEQLEWEDRTGRFAGAAAIASVICILAAPAIQIASASEQGDGELGLLRLVVGPLRLLGRRPGRSAALALPAGERQRQDHPCPHARTNHLICS